MIWDFFTRGEPSNFYDTAYGPLGYAASLRRAPMVRMPVEADVEYLFVEGVYFAWKIDRRRRLDGPPARRRGPGDGLQLHRPRALLGEVRPRQARLHDRHLGLPGRRRVTRIFPRWGTLLSTPTARSSA